MIIGHFTYDKDHDTYTGSITTLTILAVAHDSIVLTPISKAGEQGPDYRIEQRWEGGKIDIGAAWRRSSEKGRGFLSVTLDDPALPLPINAAMFLTDDQTTATLVWSRSATRAKSAEALAKTSRPKRTKAREAPATA